MIERKLAAGIETTIVGSPVGAGAMVLIPGVDNYAQPESQLAAFHDWLGRTCAEHPGRLKAYVYINATAAHFVLAALMEGGLLIVQVALVPSIHRLPTTVRARLQVLVENCIDYWLFAFTVLTALVCSAIALVGG